MSPSVGILVTNYKAWPVTEQTVLAALQHGGEAVRRVLIVDDCSDAPDAWTCDTRVSIQRNAVNLGYVRSVNAGMAMMTEDIIVMLDCDARPLTPFVDTVLSAFAADEKLGAIAFTQTDESQQLRPACEPGPAALDFLIGPSFWHHLPKGLRDSLSPPADYLCLHSCCFAFRRLAYTQVGGFDEGFDFLDADMDFSVCLNRAGWKTTFTREVVCFHPGSGSPQSTATRVIRLHRNRLRLLRKHGLMPVMPLSRLLLVSRHLVETAVLLLAVLLRRPNAHDKLSCRLRLLGGVFNDYQTC
jgi:GT2 family glycosyltransferase